MNRKGIILAGGSGTRLHPVTKVVSKQLLNVYDKPMIYYPLSTLMLADIRDILIISTPNDTPRFVELLGDGTQWGLNISYGVQPNPNGIAQAFIIGKDFIDNSMSALILGDNIFHGYGLSDLLSSASQQKNGATVFAYHVSDPERFGVVEFDSEKKAIKIVEKPKYPKTNYALTGLYFYDSQVVDIASSLVPSSRGELEITDINQIYLDNKALSVSVLDRGYAWLDTGTHESLLEASSFICTLQKRQSLLVSCPEEIAYVKGWITDEDLLELALPLSKSNYGEYLKRLIKEKFI